MAFCFSAKRHLMALGSVIAQRQNMSLCSKNHEKYKIIDKVPFLKIISKIQFSR